MKYIAVMPWVHKPYRDECVKTMHPDFRKNLLEVDNSEVNRGIMWAHNQGLKLAQDFRKDWLIIISAAIRFGKPGGMDFIKQLEKHDDHYVIHAASQNVVGGKQQTEQSGGVNAVKGWHLTGFKVDLLNEVGGWDLNFTPYSLCDIDLSIRIQKYKKGAPGWNTYPCDVSDMGMSHGINLTDKVKATYPPRNEYFTRKWGRDGGDWQAETYDHPFNDKTKPLSWWPEPPDPRAYDHGLWGLLK